MIQFIKNNSKNLTVGGAFVLLVICYFQQKENAKLRTQSTPVNTDSLTKVIDSLNSELFVKQIDLGRYEVMWGRITEIHPETVEQIEHEVE